MEESDLKTAAKEIEGSRIVIPFLSLITAETAVKETRSKNATVNTFQV